MFWDLPSFSRRCGLTQTGCSVPENVRMLNKPGLTQRTYFHPISVCCWWPFDRSSDQSQSLPGERSGVGVGVWGVLWRNLWKKCLLLGAPQFREACPLLHWFFKIAGKCPKHIFKWFKTIKYYNENLIWENMWKSQCLSLPWHDSLKWTVGATWARVLRLQYFPKESGVPTVTTEWTLLRTGCFQGSECGTLWYKVRFWTRSLFLTHFSFFFFKYNLSIFNRYGVCLVLWKEYYFVSRKCFFSWAVFVIAFKSYY